MRIPKKLLIVAMLPFLLIGGGCACNLAADRIRAATSPEAEAVAFRQMVAWCADYSVEFYDSDGEWIRWDELAPGCGQVHTIIIECPWSGQRAPHEVVEPKNVEILLLSE